MTVLLVWLHVLAAVSWIGGAIFLSVVLAPVLRREPFASQKALLFRTTALRFRAVVWGSIATLLLTGPPLLYQRGISIVDPAGWPMVLSIKLGLVAILLLFTVTHDLIIGPRVGRILQSPAESRTSSARAMVAWSPWIARSSLILALAVLLAAVVLVRS
jgi:copper resistance protein D